MKIIQKAPNPSGAYPGIQESNMQNVPKVMALWPENLDTGDFYEHNGFVSLTLEEIEGISVVTGYVPNIEAWEMWKASLPPSGSEPEPEEAVTWTALDAAYQEGVSTAYDS